MSHVVVVGAGLAGLTAALYARGDGHEVTLLERDERVGGRAGLLERDGFRFDTGPSVLTMPGLVADALRAVDVEIDDVLPLRRLDPAYRAMYADGSEIRVPASVEAFRAEVERVAGPRDAAAFDELVAWLERLYEIEMPHFIDRNFDGPLGLVSNPVVAARLLAMGGFGKLGPAMRRRFADDRLRRLFSFQALYAGLAPSRALTIYAVIAYMDLIAGVYFPERGGMHAIPRALADALEGAGGTVRTGCPVDRVLARSDGRAAGVVLADGEKVAADAVVVTADLPVAYRTVLRDLTPPRRLRNALYAPSAAVWHVGLRGLPGPEVAHHNIVFSQAWDSAFDALIDDRRLMPDPSRLVTVPSIDDPSLAPEGCTNAFVLEPVPNLTGPVDWRREAGPMQERLHRVLGQVGLPDDVVTSELVTPLDWRDQGMEAGTPFALSHTFLQTGPFRPSNLDKQMPGLVLAGSGTVPGVGVPMVLVSGKLAAERLRAYLPTAPRPVGASA